MYFDAIDVKYISSHKLDITFETGEKGSVDLSEYSKMGGVFSRFSDLNYFKQVYLDHGVLCWPGDVDIAPETIYSMATGKPLPDWLEDESGRKVTESSSADK